MSLVSTFFSFFRFYSIAIALLFFLFFSFTSLTICIILLLTVNMPFPPCSSVFFSHPSSSVSLLFTLCVSAVWISFGLLSLGRSLTVGRKYSSLSLMLVVVGWWV